MNARNTRNLFVAALAWAGLAGCQCASFATGARFLCEEDGGCPEGATCQDGVCVGLPDPDGGDGGGAGGGDAGGAGGGAAGGGVAGGGAGGGAAGGGAGGGVAVPPGPCGRGTWCWDHPKPLPYGLTLNAVYARTAADVWVVGERGNIFHFDGSAWQQVPTDAFNDLYGVWAPASNEVHFVGAGGFLARWNGNALSRPSGAPTSNLWDVAGSGPGSGVAVGDGTIGMLSGGSWVFGPNGFAGQSLYTVAHLGSGRYLAQGTAGAYFSGSAWGFTVRPGGSTISDLWAQPGGELWAVADTGLAYQNSSGQFADAGAWSTFDGGAGTSFLSVWGTGSGVTYLGNWVGIYAVTDAGSPVQASARSATGLHGAGPTGVWAVGDWAGPVRSLPDGGFVATPRQPGDGYTSIYALWTSPDDTVYAVGDQHLAWRRNPDGGWQSTPSPAQWSASRFFDVLGTSADRVYAVGGPPQQLSYWDAGANTFLPMPGFTLADSTADLESLAATGPNDVWAVGDRGAVVRWKGAGWVQVDAGFFGDLNGVAIASTGDVFAVGATDAGDGAVLRYANGQWSLEAPPATTLVDLRTVLALPSGELLVGGAGGYLARRFTDGGWVTETSGTTSSIYRLCQFRGDLYLGSWNGYLARRADAGTWVAQPIPTSSSVRALTCPDQRMMVGTGSGGALRFIP